MERLIFVEVLGRRGDVEHRVRLTQLPAFVGRAWTNEVILADSHVDARHARIDQDEQGELYIEDLGSVNGLRQGGAPARVERLALRDLAPVRVGRTMLRVATADQAVPSAVPEEVPTGRIARLVGSPRAMAAVAAAGIAQGALSVWLGDYDAKSGRELGGDIAVLITMVLMWAGLWALAGRLLVQRARFWAHATLAWLYVMTVGVWEAVNAYQAFLFPAQQVGQFLGALTMIALFVALIAAHASLASTASRRRRVALGVSLTAGLGLLVWLGDKASTDSLGNGSVPISAAIEPVPVALVPATSVAGFLEKTMTLKATVDALDE